MTEAEKAAKAFVDAPCTPKQMEHGYRIEYEAFLAGGRACEKSEQVCTAPPALTKEILRSYKPDPAHFGEPWHHCPCGAMFHLKDSPTGVCPNCRDAELAHQEATDEQG